MLSICIPCYNQHEMTRECIEAVRLNTKHYELVIIDNGSEPPIEKPYIGFGDCTMIRNETNLGFPVSVNQGIKAAKGDIICLLNNDCIVTPGWSERLIGHLEDYAIVGPVTNFSSGMQCHQVPAYENTDELNKQAAAVSEEYDGMTEEVNWVIGFCMMFKKSLFNELGDFDESLWPCSGEEVDFCLRARKAGYKVGIAHDVYVHHEGSETFKAMEQAGQMTYEDICQRNEKHLIDKWGYYSQNSLDMARKDDPQGAIRLNLGCGYAHAEGYINIDNREDVKPDLVCDILYGLPYDDNTVDEVRAYDFLEHIPLGRTIGVIEEIYRVLKPGGRFESLTPSTDGRGAFQDPTHLSFWNRNSWFYYSDERSRALYGITAHFDIEICEDKMTNKQHKIIHTFVVGKAVK